MGIFGKKPRKSTSRRKQGPLEKVKEAVDRSFVKAAATDPDARAKLIKKAYGIEIIPLDKAKQDRLAIRRAVIDKALGLATDKDISQEELEEALFPPQDMNVERGEGTCR